VRENVEPRLMPHDSFMKPQKGKKIIFRAIIIKLINDQKPSIWQESNFPLASQIQVQNEGKQRSAS
jgi:hypothetical protein